ncbi:acyl-[acyl-carrier-protein]--UDP-N-acetylglucosamine O-acyltransferase [Methylacidiphilum sp. Yel]|jgi:UDP-N-acetylglucosamine acyltransferase|uniref:acyl-ACP--UDP-N-acetylglucosamine O-acyltransferase n=1 Tax=Methylacidiphilum sp. Yel TaxID=1847730 RepID=UPI0010694B2A|nr:acyl-ACP--UDP-N-acetylglucosamine O-acyltransferase [Methylacidiphilum sp. Yel]TFE66861.1 acyl-[acyl-carrier-protein]--UDP-N-acetylglucosamine O-acyltransferase [Methylacidiphilum sp. Yel]
MIHPTAIVSSKAEIGKDVSIGPWAIVEAGCSIGDSCEIRAHAVITGNSQIGKRNQIGFGAIIGAEPQDVSFKGGFSSVIIGDDNIIREYVTIHRGSAESSVTKIGNHCFLMAGSHVAHNCLVEDQVVLVNNVLLAGYVHVGKRAFLGGAAVIHQHVRIGELTMIRGQTRIGKDLPPYFMAVDTNEVSGINRVGLKRAGITEEIRRKIEEAYKILYFSGYNVSQALEKIEKVSQCNEIQKLVDFIQKTKRGICMARKKNKKDFQEE